MTIKCLIIAAGEGTRLSDRVDSKPLMPVLGIPLIERVLTTARRSGIEEFYVVTGHNGKKVRDFLDELKGRLDVKINYIHNDEYKKANGLSVLKAKDSMEDKFLLTMSDHLLDEGLIKRFMRSPLSDGEVALAVDFDLKNPFIDLGDVTKVKVEAGEIKDIGKEITNYNGFDTGLFFCTPAIFDALEKSIKDHDDYSLSGGIRILAAKGMMKAFDIQGAFWLDVDDGAAFDKAEKYLREQREETKKDPAA